MSQNSAMESPARPIQQWKPWIFAVLAALLVVAVEQIFEHFQDRNLVQHERTHVLSHLAELRARLEGVVNGNLSAIEGLTAVIAAQPDIDQAGFALIARGIIDRNRSLRNIAGAPGMVISLMYPMSGNEAAIGLDYRIHPTQREAANRAIESGESVLAGPLPLVQGGQGLIARAPVFLSSQGTDRPPALWGLVSAVMDIRQTYRLAGLPLSGHLDGLSLALRGKDGLGAMGETFYGDPTLFDTDSVILSVSLPGGSWQFAALPMGGWDAITHGNPHTIVRILGFGLALLLAAMLYLLTRRNAELQQRSAELRKSQSLFQGFMQNLPAGAFVHDPESGQSLFENHWLKTHLSDHQDGCGLALRHDLETLESGSQLLQDQRYGDQDPPMYCDTLRFILSGTGRSSLIGGVIMDVTDRVVALDELKSNRARLRALFDTLPDLVWLKDPDGVYLACNRRFEALFGASEKEIAGKRDHDFVDRGLADFFREKDLAAMAAGKPVTNEETVTFASDGHQETLETIKAPVLDVDGRLIGVLGIARDITERQQMQLDQQSRFDELSRWQGVILGREDRILELKREVNALLIKHGAEPRYRTGSESQ